MSDEKTKTQEEVLADLVKAVQELTQAVKEQNGLNREALAKELSELRRVLMTHKH